MKYIALSFFLLAMTTSYAMDTELNQIIKEKNSENNFSAVEIVYGCNNCNPYCWKTITNRKKVHSVLLDTVETRQLSVVVTTFDSAHRD